MTTGAVGFPEERALKQGTVQLSLYTSQIFKILPSYRFQNLCNLLGSGAFREGSILKMSYIITNKLIKRGKRTALQL
jgi:hypothetical protein